ncbi:glycosyltransferase [uncultured Polaribacter sp.]|uniref:glycosyltransferase n=1 Tax=uncultured Polaribacter sp. TaxID=174711 RepID=UPI0026090762|nr:glycosyltransferase [uncultured Polaribacter sp.]
MIAYSKKEKFNDKEVLVSISCLTFNHELYIRQCLEGFIIQKTNFAFEVLIHDDASTDKTAEIIKEYEVKYPEIIKPIYQSENQYSKGVSVSSAYNFPRAKGKYIAMCEGDDYWTDPLKLQKQFDYLEMNKNCSLVFTNYSIAYDNNKVIKNEHISDYSFNGIFKTNPIRTVSVCFRADYLNEIINNKPKDYPFLDLSLFLSLAIKGEIGLINENTCVYRYHYSSMTHIRDIETKLKFIETKFKIRNYFIENFNLKPELKKYAITNRLIEGYKSTLIYDLDRKYIDFERNKIKKYKDYNIPITFRIFSKNVWLEKIFRYFVGYYLSIKKRK